MPPAPIESFKPQLGTNRSILTEEILMENDPFNGIQNPTIIDARQMGGEFNMGKHIGHIFGNQVWVGRSARLTETLEKQDLPFGDRG